MLVLGVTVVFHLLIPAALFSWQWWGRERCRIEWLLKTTAVGAYLVLVLLAGVWVAVPWYVGYVYLGLWAAIGMRELWRIGPAGGQPGIGFRVAVYGAAAALSMTGTLYAWMGHRPLDEEPVDLAFPLRGGTYYVVSAGSNALTNLHFKTLDEQLRRFRGQSYAVDIVKLNRYGTRASSAWPRRLADYEIFGEALYAPCAGTVAAVENALPDLVPPARDLTNLAGNFVAIDCRGVRVLLAHLRQGSVLVKTGEAVTVGQKLGQIGNSGNTDEPHLHIHAERPADWRRLLDAEPVPMRLGGRFLARNDRVRAI